LADGLSTGYAVRLAGLWTCWLLVMLFHVELGLMPLFHGLAVEIHSRISSRRLPGLFLAMLIYFLLPVGALLVAIHAVADPTGWSARPAWRAAQFWFSLVYSVTNVLHLVADIRIPDSRSDQVVLMTVLTLIGLLINQQAWAWWQR
jgi:hypothetical protein